MVRTTFLLLFAGGLTVGLYTSKPTTSDFRHELEARSHTVWGHDSAVTRVIGTHPLDELVVILSPDDAVRRTTIKDFYLVNIFETTYEAVGLRRRIRTVGLASSFFVLPDRHFILDEDKRVARKMSFLQAIR